MNFLSHFYFDRHSTDPDRVIGVVLPDLVKNARKEWCLRPEKQNILLLDEGRLNSIYTGWQRHIEVDKHFHSSDFFCYHTREIKTRISPILKTSVVRPSFVAHIALELMLDALLLTESIIEADRFYTRISEADRGSLKHFLRINKIDDTTPFFTFLDEFIETSYLNNYRDSAHIMYSISRICMRLWANPFTDKQKLQLTMVLIDYQQQLQEDFMRIFDQIDDIVNEPDAL